MGHLFFEVLRRKTHFLCDYGEDATAMHIKEDLKKFLGVPLDKQTLKAQLPEHSDWLVLDDAKLLTDYGFTSRNAKPDSPALIALIIADEETDVNYDRMSSPPPMPEAMRARDSVEGDA